ncbi:MAG: hypothetical protein DRI30_05060 [Chloroflexi bacterium]|nr:MAG: hypothetical protein DRI30_05060 [Chloroflexota bacterium]
MSNAQMIAITQEAKQIHAEEKARPLIDCPIDGTLLDNNGKYLNCPLGNYRTRIGATHGSDD